MAFSCKRGRPAIKRPDKDTGTPELVAKRKLGLTDEPLDYCLKQGWITQDQHWAGIHFRWLYTIVFGTPTVSSIDYLRNYDIHFIQRDDEWYKRREKEYNDTVNLLSNRDRQLVTEVCIYNKFSPDLLNHLKNSLNILYSNWVYR